MARERYRIADLTVDVEAVSVRRALGDDAKSPRYLRAVRGRGTS